MFRRVVLWGSVLGIVVAGALPLAAQADTINPPLPETPEATAPLKRAISLSQPRGFSAVDRKKVIALAKKSWCSSISRQGRHPRAGEGAPHE